MKVIKIERVSWLGRVFLLIGSFLLADCSRIPMPQLDPESRQFYELAKLIISKEEDKIFRLLPDAESRKEFIREFWEKRDPFPETPENEFQQEFLARVFFADQRFKEGGKGRDTDRGRIYIFLGPPDKIDEVFTHYDPSVRGSIITWIYYDYGLGIEFVDERGTGQYKIRQISGDIFEAMDILKLGGRFGPDSVFKDRVVKFELKYLDKEKKIKISLPVKSLNFSEDEEGNNFVDLQFVFYVYTLNGQKIGKYVENRIYKVSLRELLELKEISFYFDLELPGGKGIVDVTISGRGEKGGRIRRLFEIK
ncbi:MAG: GWxTD domain-containing protein [Candidatus Aminicenantes bacterium]|nr:GWxTD domain-containing protein [Candidatus Aminicenantes bacterium]